MATVLVTGASGGIGAALCAALAARGATLVLHYHSDRAAAQRTMGALPGKGHRMVQADLGDARAVQGLWQETASAGGIDAVINNAGIFPNQPRSRPTTRTGRMPGSARSPPICSVPHTFLTGRRAPWPTRAVAGS